VAERIAALGEGRCHLDNPNGDANLFPCLNPPLTSLRSRDSFDFDWLFHKGDARGAQRPAFNDARWRPLSLPHDWSIEGPFRKDAPGGGSHGWSPNGIGWYRKHFNLDRAGKVFIEFDGVYHNSDVWINGVHLGHRAYGYSSFHYDLTPHVNVGGENVIAVRVDNSDVPNCRWYSGSGIYRHVWLTRTAKTHVAHWGTYVTTRGASVRIHTRVEGNRKYRVETTIHDDAGKVVARGSGETFNIPRPRLWSIDDPAVYFARSVVHVDGRPVDDYVTPFGIRAVRFDARRGMLLNGEPVKMKGVCLHHDAGCVGAAVPDGVLERRLKILKELGCNAIRCSHNPPAPELLDLCDRMGFLVIDEAFDKWEGKFSKPKEWWWRQRDFARNWEQDLRAMLERDRNHPCVVMWSVGNETGQPGTSQVDPTLRRLVNFIRQEEPTRAITAALVNSNAKTLKQRIARIRSCAKLIDVLSLNYQEPLYDHFHRADPKLILCGTESFKHWRGGEMSIYTYDPHNPWYDCAKHDYVTGQFLWPGFDYLGEWHTWPIKGWGNGILDTCGFLRPEGWFQRSVWRSDPLVRIAVITCEGMATPWAAPAMVEHWNFPKSIGQLLKLRTQTNCQTVELIVNKRSYGVRRAADHLNNAIEWHVPYQAGTVTAIARNGTRTVARHVLNTAGPARTIALRVDRSRIAADGLDVAHIEVNLLDAAGVLVPDDDRAITFALHGPGRIIGVDNGNLASLESYQGKSRSTLGGRCLAIVQSAHVPGRITLTARAGRLRATQSLIVQPR
jgi:beta-galactosidase